MNFLPSVLIRGLEQRALNLLVVYLGLTSKTLDFLMSAVLILVDLFYSKEVNIDLSESRSYECFMSFRYSVDGANVKNDCVLHFLVR